MVPLQSAKAILTLPKGSFGNPDEGFYVRLTFNSISYQVFVLTAKLAECICDVDDTVKQSIETLESSKITESLTKAKVCHLSYALHSHYRIIYFCDAGSILLPCEGERVAIGLLAYAVIGAHR